MQVSSSRGSTCPLDLRVATESARRRRASSPPATETSATSSRSSDERWRQKGCSDTFAAVMARINEHYAKLPASYLFPEIGRRVRAYSAAHPDAKVIRLGIGDVTEPLAPAIVDAMHAAVS